MTIPQIAARPITVLVVEDDILARFPIATYLQDEGFNVLEATSAEEAARLFASDAEIDVLFTDLRVSGRLDGWDIAEQFRATRPHGGVIYATGYSTIMPRMVPNSLFFPKPYRLEEIVEAVRNLTSAPRP